MAKARTTAAAFEHCFVGTLETIDYGRMVYWVIYLSNKLAKISPFAEGRRARMRGTLETTVTKSVSLAWQISKGRHYLLIGRPLARTLRVSLGDRVTVAFSLVTDNAVTIPAEIAEALRQEPAWRSLWDALTPGAQRGLAYRVDSAKLPETRARRAVEVLRDLEDGRPARPPRRVRL